MDEINKYLIPELSNIVNEYTKQLFVIHHERRSIWDRNLEKVSPTWERGEIQNIDGIIFDTLINIKKLCKDMNLLSDDTHMLFFYKPVKLLQNFYKNSLVRIKKNKIEELLKRSNYNHSSFFKKNNYEIIEDNKKSKHRLSI